MKGWFWVLWNGREYLVIHRDSVVARYKYYFAAVRAAKRLAELTQ